MTKKILQVQLDLDMMDGNPVAYAKMLVKLGTEIVGYGQDLRTPRLAEKLGKEVPMLIQGTDGENDDICTIDVRVIEGQMPTMEVTDDTADELKRVEIVA